MGLGLFGVLYLLLGAIRNEQFGGFQVLRATVDVPSFVTSIHCPFTFTSTFAVLTGSLELNTTRMSFDPIVDVITPLPLL